MKYFVILLTVALCAAREIDDSPSSRITNGNLAAENQFPYMVSVQDTSQLALATRGHRCGGVMITFLHTLTAASCLYSVVNETLVEININAFRVFAGSTLLTNDNVQDRIRFIVNATIHPEYVPAPALLNDISVLTLSSPFPNTIVTPIALPAESFNPAEWTVCTVAGWGAPDATALASTELRFARKYIYNQSLCATIYNGIPYITNVFPSMLCAASFDIVSAGCFGDLGNALVCNGELAGILFLTNNCSPSSFPELYTRVPNYIPWIRSVTSASNNFRPDFILWSMFALIQVVALKVMS